MSDFILKDTKDRPACSPDVFSFYFEFIVPDNNAEMALPT